MRVVNNRAPKKKI